MAIFDLREISGGQDTLMFTDDTASTCGGLIFTNPLVLGL